MIQRNILNNNKIFAHTYSIVARDPKMGLLGVGVQSHWFSVGRVVSWGESGIGVVATQSFVNKSFGLRGLDLLKHGKTPKEVIEILLSDDQGRDLRQVSILDNRGRIATHTGSNCIKEAGHIIGKNFSAQANMMLSNQVWLAMGEAFEKHQNLPLPEKIVKCLEAAESAGGDIRGKQSAALLIVAVQAPKNKWEDPIMDLRVEDHKEPLKEIGRLVKVWRAYEHMNNGDLAVEEGDINSAFEEYNAAMEKFPNSLEMRYWTAIALANNDKIDESLVLFKNIFQENKNWRVLTARLPEVGLLNLKDEDLNKILSL